MPYIPNEVLEMPQGFFFRGAINLDLSNKCTLACLACVRVKEFGGSNKLVPGHQMTDHEWSLYCLLYTSPSPRDKRQSRMPSSA